MTYSIIPVHLAVKAMRDNGYKNAAYALAELMDNSIQAGAKNVELLCGEIENKSLTRVRKNIYEIAILDDACGMNAETLRIALQFGNGTRLEPSAQTGIGRFGMGLPASSISQCERVEVWTWQNGINNSIYSYLDLHEINSSNLSDVPNPVRKEIPEVWRKSGKNWGGSGTLVVWSKLDRISWRTAKAVMDNSEFIIGRMYRRFLVDHRLKIRMVAFDFNRPENFTEDYVLPNDPGYLMSETSTPAPWDKVPMFHPWPKDSDYIVIHTISFRGKPYDVKITYSYAKEEARLSRGGQDAGHSAYGKHAKKNTGVSIVRADRELELDDSWADTSDPRDRWWGIEVDFPPGLDEVFGVTNNKQHAHNLSELANFEPGDISLAEYLDVLKELDDPRAPLVELASKIQRDRNVLRAQIKAQAKGSRSAQRGRHDTNLAEIRATEVTAQRQAEGFTGKSDAEEQLPPEEREKAIKEALVEQGLSPVDATVFAAQTIKDGLKYRFIVGEVDSEAFFTTKQKGGTIIITLNVHHPAYDSLLEVLSEDTENVDIEELKDRLKRSSDGLKLLLYAWARYEDEQPDGPRKTMTQSVRTDWGRVARQFLEK